LPIIINLKIGGRPTVINRDKLQYTERNTLQVSSVLLLLFFLSYNTGIKTGIKNQKKGEMSLLFGIDFCLNN